MSTKIPIVKVKILEKLLFALGLNQNGKVEVMFFTGIQMEDIPHFRTMATRIWGAH